MIVTMIMMVMEPTDRILYCSLVAGEHGEGGMSISAPSAIK